MAEAGAGDVKAVGIAIKLISDSRKSNIPSAIRTVKNTCTDEMS